MQLPNDTSNKNDEVKIQFRTREGYYELMNCPDYSHRSQRPIGFSTNSTASNTVNSSSSDRTTIKISLVKVKRSNANNPADHETYVNSSPNHYPPSARYASNHQSSNISENGSSFQQQQQQRTSPLNTIEANCDSFEEKKICFNVGRELFVYNYDGVKRGPDASRPIYKKAYKVSMPTCHDFNQSSACHESILLLVGFTQGQVQLIDLMERTDVESSRLYNEDRLIDKTNVTCVKWLPGSSNFFLVAHASGQLYVYKADLSCGTTAPSYQIYRQGEGVTIYTCKTKTVRNPVYRWSIGQGNHQGFSSGSCSLNEFAFSPCAKYLACVSQDGFLRVFCYDTMELIGRVRSYYGGLLCVCWSPDSKFVVTGGEDDLITIWSFLEKRVIARGQGHKSWINVVAFDPFCASFESRMDAQEHSNRLEDSDSDDCDDRLTNGLINSSSNHSNTISPRSATNRSSSLGYHTPNQMSTRSRQVGALSSYRFGSVGQDTLLCFWDLSDDIINHPVAKSRTSVMLNPHTPLTKVASSSTTLLPKTIVPRSGPMIDNGHVSNESTNNRSETFQANTNHHGQYIGNTMPSLFKSEMTSKSFTLGKKEKRQFSLTSRISDKHGINRLNQSKLSDDPVKLLGTPTCPRIDDVPMLEPTVCKKISYDRLTSLIFCHDGFITSCQDGLVFSWSRPGRLKHKMYTGRTGGQSNEELHVIDVGATSIV